MAAASWPDPLHCRGGGNSSRGGRVSVPTESERFVGYSIGFKGTHGVCVKMGDLPSGYD